MHGLSVGFTCRPTRATVAAFEDMPIDSLWAGGHVVAPNPTSEAMVALAQLSALATRVRIGSSILLLPLYPPAIVAKQVADIDRATGGRVTLGIGVGGEYPAEFRACQVPREERGRRTDEAMGLLRRLWQGETITHDGRFYAMSDVRIQPPPAQPGGPPIVVAGRQEAAMRRAALLGDGWMPYLYSARRYGESVQRIRELAAADGRDLSAFEWMAFIFVNVHDDHDAAIAGAARSLGRQYSQDFEAMVGSVAVAGTRGEVIAGLNRFVQAGMRHLILAPASGGDNAALIETLGRHVIPQLGAG